MHQKRSLAPHITKWSTYVFKSLFCFKSKFLLGMGIVLNTIQILLKANIVDIDTNTINLNYEMYSIMYIHIKQNVLDKFTAVR